MDVRNCKKCGKLFNFTGEPLCPACAKELESKFFEVRTYIYDNPIFLITCEQASIVLPVV